MRKQNCKSGRLVFLVALMSFSPWLLGCSGGGSETKMLKDAFDSNIQRCATMYTRFHQAHKNRGPADEAEFVQFLEQEDANRLEMLGIDAGDRKSILTSERDGQPFKIRWGMDTRVRGPALPVIFESTGVDGKFMVGFAGATPKEVDKAEYDKLWATEPENLPDDSDGRPGGR